MAASNGCQAKGHRGEKQEYQFMCLAKGLSSAPVSSLNL